jgi:hypothetical protein
MGKSEIKKGENEDAAPRRNASTQYRLGRNGEFIVAPLRGMDVQKNLGGKAQ